MELDRHFANAEVKGDLFVEASARHFMQNLTLAWRQRFNALDVALDDHGIRPPLGIHRNTRDDGVKQRLVPHRLSEKVHGAGLHRLDSHRDVAMPGKEDDGFGVAVFRKMLLQIEAARSWHAHVEDQAAGAVQNVGVDQLAGRGKANWLETRRQDQFR